LWTAFAVSLLLIKILFLHNAETIKERIGDSIVTASAVAILIGIIISILAGIIHGFRAGKESIYCDGNYGFLAGTLAFIAMIFLTFIKTIIATIYKIYNIYREE
jgi:ABC-type antimicrobial peptide transport system permease subunit